jgi:hypothetical protein
VVRFLEIVLTFFSFETRLVRLGFEGFKAEAGTRFISRVEKVSVLIGAIRLPLGGGD